MNRNALRTALRLGIASALLLVVLEILYAVVLILGLSKLDGPGAPIPDPYFTVMEVLILAIMPPLILLAIAVHSSCAPDRKPFAFASVIFIAIATTVTTAVHSSILFLSRAPAFADMNHVFSFEWPSVVYVLDILAWDVFFAFFAIFLALALDRHGVEGWARRLSFLSGLLAFTGLWGAVAGDMQIRNIGIIGYVGVFPVAALLIALSMKQRLAHEDA
ncbi:MAG: hypothetical protein QNJ20_08195 [Paracoccaceae bacterium]|nr:hypothetical protein [Paracoccaceae bacterium]